MQLKRLMIGAVVALAVPASASATTINVTPGGTDDGPVGNAAACTTSGSGISCPVLRDAVAYANAHMAGTDPTIQLAPGSFNLSTYAIFPNVTMTIAGAGNTGSTTSTIAQNVASETNVIDPGAAITLKDLIVTGANVVGTAGATEFGGGIEESTTAALTLTNVSVTGNKVTGGAGTSSATGGGTGGSAFGSAIEMNGGLLTLDNSIISGNVADGGNGGTTSGTGNAGNGGNASDTVFAAGGLVMSGTTISDNATTAGNGGNAPISGAQGGSGGASVGAALLADGLTISGSTVTGNIGTGGDGGTAANASEAAGNGNFAQDTIDDIGPLTMTTTTVSGNQENGGNGADATGVGGTGGSAGGAGGGGVDVSSHAVSIANSVISNNVVASGSAGNDAASLGVGGNAAAVDGAGIAISNGSPVSITQSTISRNQATAAGPGSGGLGGAGGTGNESFGGGAAFSGGAATVVNSTIFGNTVSTGAGPGGSVSLGGGIGSAGAGATVGLYSDTVYGNSAQAASASHQDGANVGGDGGAFVLEDTAIGSPSPAGAPNCGSGIATATFTDNGHNLEDTTPSTCGLTTANHDLIGSIPKLPAALGANGSATGPTDPSTGYVGTYTLAPAAGSPLIGGGGACVNPLAAGNPPLTVDQRGFARPATCDIGAFQTQPLKVTGTPAITGTPVVGHTLTCSTGTFASTGDGVLTSSGQVGAPTIAYAWTSGSTKLATSSTYTVAATDAGHSITCTETATGAYGSASATSSAVKAPSGPVSLTNVGQAHKSWAEQKRKRKHKTPIGTAFTFTLNEAAAVKLTFTTTLHGRKVKHKCVAQTKHNKRDPKCTTTVTIGTLTVNGHTGANTVSFTGKVGKHRLAPGNYKVTITATSGTSKSSKSLGFTIVK